MNRPFRVQNYRERGYQCKVLLCGDHLCGYVAVSDEQHDIIGDMDGITVHGGVTYQGYDDDKLWIGFDCAHYGDTLEKCNIGFVKNEISTMISQFIEREYNHANISDSRPS